MNELFKKDIEGKNTYFWISAQFLSSHHVKARILSPKKLIQKKDMLIVHLFQIFFFVEWLFICLPTKYVHVYMCMCNYLHFLCIDILSA